MALAWPQIYVYCSLIIAACMEDTERAATKIEAKIPEEAMRKSLILALTAIGGGVGYAAGVTEVATGPTTDDSSTWRWHVSSILAAQGNTTSPARGNCRRARRRGIQSTLRALYPTGVAAAAWRLALEASGERDRAAIRVDDAPLSTGLTTRRSRAAAADSDLG